MSLYQMVAKSYQIIYADPPWHYEQRQGNNDISKCYPTLSIDELCAMREYVDSVADTNCLLFMWITSPLLKEAWQLIEAWGFEFATVAFMWNKMRTNIGHYTLGQTEQVWVAKRGTIPDPRGSRNEHQYIAEAPREHSRKPDEVRSRMERMFPTQNKLEMFARIQMPGWDVYGNQVEKFNGQSLLEFT